MELLSSMPDPRFLRGRLSQHTFAISRQEYRACLDCRLDANDCRVWALEKRWSSNALTDEDLIEFPKGDELHQVVSSKYILQYARQCVSAAKTTKNKKLRAKIIKSKKRIFQDQSAADHWAASIHALVKHGVARNETSAKQASPLT